MKTIGLIGGLSWESSVIYYQLINRGVNASLGKHNSSKSLLYSLNFEEIQQMQHENNWKQLKLIMIEAAQKLEKGGADMILICSNTMHFCSDFINTNISIPLIHIVECTGQELNPYNFTKVGLLGTRFTMESQMYPNILNEQFGIEVIVPNSEEMAIVHEIIYEELVKGLINKESREAYKQIIKGLKEKGAQGVILGCTEIPLLIKESDVDIPIFDTTAIHAKKTVELALQSNQPTI